MADAISIAHACEPQQESIFDKVVHLEQRVLTEIPDTPRWEERLELKVRRVDVGGAALHIEEQGSGVPLVLINGGPGGTHHGFHPWFGRAKDFARVGFALYDTERYEDALRAFNRLEELAEADGSPGRVAMSLIWQGHVLDLLGRREEAIARYQRVVEMDSRDGVRHDQYGLAYEYSPYAAERLGTPFKRVENTEP